MTRKRSYRQWLESKRDMLAAVELPGSDYWSDWEGRRPSQEDIDRILPEARAWALTQNRPDLARLCQGDPAEAIAACLQALEGDDLLTADQVAAMFKVNVRTIRRRVADGTFPKPVQVGRSKRWRKVELDRLW